MMFETSRRRSVSLCRSWQFKICFVWGGELVSTLTSSILQMGLIWHIALTTGSSSLLSLASLAGFLPIALFGVLAGAVVDRYRGLFALLWCGFVFAFAFSPLAALFPIMTLGHFGGSTGDAALAEILFSAGMLAGSGILAVTGGFRNRSLTMVAAIAGFGIAAIVSGSLGPSLFAAFLPVSFLMGACSPLYAGTQTALMQEQIPPEYLGRVFGLYGTIMAWAMPMGLAAPSVFADLLGAPLWFVGSGATMVLLAMAMLLAPSVRNVGKKDSGQIQ